MRFLRINQHCISYWRIYQKKRLSKSTEKRLSTSQGRIPMPLPLGSCGLLNTVIHSFLFNTKERICTAGVVVGMIV